MQETETASHAVPFEPLGAELAGTALLVLVGLSIVIFDFGQGSPLVQLLPDAGMAAADHRLPVRHDGRPDRAFAARQGKRRAHQSRRHLRFLADGPDEGTPRARAMWSANSPARSSAPCPCSSGARWGAASTSARRFPAPASAIWGALLGETVTTFALIFGLFFFLRHQDIRRLHARPVSAAVCDHGLARSAPSRGPAPIRRAASGRPSSPAPGMAGGSTGSARCRNAAGGRALQAGRVSNGGVIEVAKIHHFGHDPYGIFQCPIQTERGMPMKAPAAA